MDHDTMMIIADSSPLISLALINKLNVREHFYREMYVPTAVYDEVSRNDKPCSRTLHQFLQGKTRRVKNIMAVDILLSDIGTGEAEAIVLALEHQPAMLLVDDLKARKLAKMKGLNIIGTLGILLQAKKAGLLGEIQPLIVELVSNNIRIGAKIIELTLQAAQESEM